MEKTEVPFGFEKDGKLFLSSWSTHADREIGEVRDENIEKSATFFIERFSDMEKKVNEVAEKIDSTENKGSFLMKLLHLKEQLPAHDGLGDYLSLHHKIEKYEELVKDIIQKNRERNTEIKSALVEEAKVAVEEINWKEGTVKVNDLKARWIKTGNAEEGKNEALEEAFWALITGFFECKKNFYDDKQKLLDHRRRQYEGLVAEAENINQLHGKQRFDKVKHLREQWGTIGGVPNDVFKPLMEKFNAALRPKSSTPPKDYSAILQSLTEIKKNTASFNKNELDQIRKNVFRDKTRNMDKGKVLELIQLLVERDFIIKLSKKRFSNFAELPPEKKKSIRLGIVNDLLARDKEDLKIYEENSAKFSSSDGSMGKVVESKLKGQKRKIDVKLKLLEWVEQDEF